MAAEFYRDDGSVWRQAAELYFDDGTVWRRATEVYFDDGANWRLVFQKAVDLATASIVAEGGDTRFNWTVNGQAVGAFVRLFQGIIQIGSDLPATDLTALGGIAPNGTFSIELYDPDGTLLDTFTDTLP